VEPDAAESRLLSESDSEQESFRLSISKMDAVLVGLEELEELLLLLLAGGDDGDELDLTREDDFDDVDLRELVASGFGDFIGLGVGEAGLPGSVEDLLQGFGEDFSEDLLEGDGVDFPMDLLDGKGVDFSTDLLDSFGVDLSSDLL